MLNKFNRFIEDKFLCHPNNTVLVALSGGADSVALLHLFKQAGYKLGAAHCNFMLRGKDADADEKFVRELCKRMDIPLYVKSFETEKVAKEQGVSIEMAARELRYTWFNEICDEHNYDLIATGHHLNDSIETLFLNLTRGTGIKGLTGINAKNNNTIRPLLWSTREEIHNYLKHEGIHWQHDKSNDENVYRRNLIRNQVLPLLKQLNPAFEQTMQSNLEIMEDTSTLLSMNLEQCKSKVLQKDNNQWIINREKLADFKPSRLFLFEILQPFGFNIDTVNKLLVLPENSSGQLYSSSTHELLCDRENFIIREPKENVINEFLINSLDELNTLPIKLSAELFTSIGYETIKKKQTANLDFDKLVFPLKIRLRQQGDFFYPFGMRGKKKLSDFFIDQKLSRFDKEKVWILESNGAIAWVIGLRIDNRFCINPNTRQILRLTLISK